MERERKEMEKLNNAENKTEGEKGDSRHFSHDHPLELSLNTGDVNCMGCGIHVLPSKPYYTCKTCCAFSLHSACFNMPRKIHHPAHLGHDLILLLQPSFACKACGKPGAGFAYNCRVCRQDYHSLCSVLPLSASHHSHPHALTLEFSPPYDGVKAFRCDICRGLGYDHWLYRCGSCGFDVHLHCALSNQPPQPWPQPQPQPQVGCSGDSFNQTSMNSNSVQMNQNYAYIHGSSNQGTNKLVYYLQPNGSRGVAVHGGQNNQRGMIMGSVGSGMGQAIGQEMVHSAISGFGNGSSISGKDDDGSGILTSWLGIGAGILL